MNKKIFYPCLTALLGIFLLPLLVAAQAPKSKSGKITTSDGVQIHFLESGRRAKLSIETPHETVIAGPAILFIPGWTMPGWIWENQITHFSKTHRVVAIDPRGQGDSSKPTEGYFPAARARDIKGVVDQLKLAPVVLVGWSMGVGEVVAYVDQFGTKDLAGIVLVDGFTGGDFDAQTTAIILNFAGAFLKDRVKFADAFVRSMYKKPQAEAYLQRVIAASKQTPTSAGAALFLGMITTDTRAVLGKIDKPTLITIAAGSPWDAVYEDMQKRIPGSRLEKFDGVGHALFVDDAAKFNTLLEEFLKPLSR